MRAMTCTRCHKPLTRAYVSDGPFSWGPKCAKAAGFTKPTGPRAPNRVDHVPDAGQMILVLEPITARHSHAYMLRGEKVIALEDGEHPRVGVVAEPWFSRFERVPASELVPMGLRYLHGALP